MTALSMWRTELVHPFTVHLPIALLPLSTLVLLVSIALKRYSQKLEFTLGFLLTAGVAGAWIAVLTGDQAESIVNRVICDPTLTAAHDDQSRLASILYSIVLLIQFSMRWIRGEDQVRLAACVRVVQAIVASAAAVLLVLAAHKGAALVYQQGAAVYRTSETCSEFE